MHDIIKIINFTPREIFSLKLNKKNILKSEIKITEIIADLVPSSIMTINKDANKKPIVSLLHNNNGMANSIKYLSKGLGMKTNLNPSFAV